MSPIYDFECAAGHRFERFNGSPATGIRVACEAPGCHEQAEQRTFAQTQTLTPKGQHKAPKKRRPVWV